MTVISVRWVTTAYIKLGALTMVVQRNRKCLRLCCSVPGDWGGGPWALSGLPPVTVRCWVGATASSTQVSIAVVFVSTLASPRPVEQPAYLSHRSCRGAVLGEEAVLLSVVRNIQAVAACMAV